MNLVHRNDNLVDDFGASEGGACQVQEAAEPH